MSGNCIWKHGTRKSKMKTIKEREIPKKRGKNPQNWGGWCASRAPHLTAAMTTRTTTKAVNFHATRKKHTKTKAKHKIIRFVVYSNSSCIYICAPHWQSFVIHHSFPKRARSLARSLTLWQYAVSQLNVAMYFGSIPMSHAHIQNKTTKLFNIWLI